MEMTLYEAALATIHREYAAKARRSISILALFGCEWRANRVARDKCGSSSRSPSCVRRVQYHHVTTIDLTQICKFLLGKSSMFPPNLRTDCNQDF